MTQTSDPDRFFNRTSPGAHEWWYFDAISEDGRDAIVIVFYAGLPFDPSYGVATLRHLKNPSKYPQPRALDHSAVGFSWYRDGKAIAYALNGFKADQFRHQVSPFAVEISTSRVQRDSDGYFLTIETPSVEGRPILARFQFIPALCTEPFERDLGTPEAPHNWLLAASDCQVEGLATFGGEERSFKGRGYHDHNAGAEDLSAAMKRWEWGRVHHGTEAEIYYISQPKHGNDQSLWITCVNGRPEVVREGVAIERFGGRKGNVFGIRHDQFLGINDREDLLIHSTGAIVDDGPFYRRWLGHFSCPNDPEFNPWARPIGICELLDTRNLHKPWFNWMIPYRLKWPKT